MSEDSKEKNPNQQSFTYGVWTDDYIRIIQSVAPKFGVIIQTLAKEGEENPALKTSRVPKGNSFIAIGSQTKDLSNFWNAVRAEEKVQQPPANPPKI